MKTNENQAGNLSRFLAEGQHEGENTFAVELEKIAFARRGESIHQEV